QPPQQPEPVGDHTSPGDPPAGHPDHPGQVQHRLAVAREPRVLAGERAVPHGVEGDPGYRGEQHADVGPAGLHQAVRRLAVVDGDPGEVPGGQPRAYYGLRRLISRNGPGIPRRDGRGLDRVRTVTGELAPAAEVVLLDVVLQQPLPVPAVQADAGPGRAGAVVPGRGAVLGEAQGQPVAGADDLVDGQAQPGELAELGGGGGL